MAEGYTESQYLPINKWSEDDRPREKLLTKGKSALSDAELIAILIGSGYKDKSAVEVSRIILQEVGNDLSQLARLNVKQLTKFKGIGEAKAISIVAALELGRRRKDVAVEVKSKIITSLDAYQYFYPHLVDLSHEEFFIILLSRNNTVLKHLQISKGGVAGTVVDAKVIFKYALEEMASSVILCHNHPSGNLQPSQQDIELTKKLIQAGKSLDILVIDHIIFTNEKHYSFADEGMMR
ncbi:MAG: DNA repair protein RadC [Bacteroidetes bacterium]|nr:DNA repair protein RadC [Bacteroidota bacterium]